MATAFPAELDFTLPAGDSAILQITVKNPDLSVMDLTGASLKWSSQQLDDVTTRIDLTAGNGLAIVDAVNGRVDVNIPKATMIVAGPHRHELEVIDAGGESQTVLQGIVTVIRTLNPAT
jgi:hypothetical protein